MSDIPTGRICWYELLTSDPSGATSFYPSVVGWNTTVFEGAADPYTMWVNGEQPIGGVMQLPPEAVAGGAPPHWLMYVSTPDIVATAEKAVALGGKIVHGPMEIPEVGIICILEDPTGPVFAAYQPSGDAPGHDDLPGVGEVSWNEVYSPDVDAAWDFYSELFGWEKADSMDMGEQGIYQMFSRGGPTLGGFMNKPEQMPHPCWVFYMRVEDINAAAEAVKANGGTVFNEPMEVPGGDLVAHFIDPQGAMFACHQGVSGEMV